MSKSWFEETMDIIRDLKKERVVKEVSVLGKDLIVYPDVFSPAYFTDALYFAKNVPTIVGTGSFCEVGVGTGIISLFVGLNGAKSVTGTDINPEAIKNTRANFDKHNLQIDLYQSDVLDSVPQKKMFDFIFWNHPFNKVDFEIKEPILNSVLDTNFNALEKFFATASNHLNKEGRLILGSGELADQTEIAAFASKHCWKQVDFLKAVSTVRVGGNRPMALYIHIYKK